MGADAVVMMRFDSVAISDDMQSVAAYGTAVKFK
ncbi:heavy metal-binding domain-containing protein [Paucilactobacillus nenjiangensis]|nr:heavy metal-binding domain-containing protein [Paucilactobacillus nenjiangensis]